jgi:hypothetical protein
VHIIELASLVAKNQNRTSDPVVFVDVGGKTKSTKIMYNCTQVGRSCRSVATDMAHQVTWCRV